VTSKRLVTFAALVAALAWALMTVGAYVRVSDSGLGCPDWPACHGQLVAGGHHALIEQVHRWIVTVLSIALVVLAALVYRLRRGERRVTMAMTITLALLGLQVVLGGVTVLLNNVSWTVVMHYGAAAALLAAVLLVVVRLAFPEAETPPRDAYVRLVTWLAGITYGLLLMGATVATTDSHESCGKSFPLCKGSVIPSVDHHVVIHMAHRVWAGIALVLALWTWRQTSRLRPGVWHLEAAARGMASLFLAQAAVGVAVVEAGENSVLEVLHSSLASLTWLAVATLLWMARTLPAPQLVRSGDTPDRGQARTIVADYMTLLKPRIMVLILITAYGAMAFAADGLPSAGLTAWTLLGLGLSSGGASAINHYLDRDLYARMTRTAGRPVPSGRVAPEAALGYGTGLIIASFAVLAQNVNLISAALALSGALTYVVVYTYWLKRRTPLNIVIGGAAGAVPPLVGWAAVTGHVGLPAAFMFAIIFLWTPPHFWALAILAKREYANAGIPMLPVVRGERETARQILIYTLVLVGISLLPFADRTFGWVYLTGALALGAEFVLLAVRLVRDTSPPAARRLFLYSLAYLALLFVVIGLDRARLS
jgi:protoheme IX farnesyltransferase